VGGDYAQVVAIVKPGVDPHEFQPTPNDIKTINEADVVLITGKGIEGYLRKLEENVGKGKFVDTGKTFPSLRMEEDGKEVEDPHWWHSIDNVKKATLVVRDALSKADATHKVEFEKNADAYLSTLHDLEKWAKEKVAELPRNKRKLVTSHDAFQYFARDFGFKIYAVEGVSTEDEPSSKKVAVLIQNIKDQGVKAIFAENIENPKVLREITKETEANLGGELYADGLGEKEASTYVEMIKHNISTIVTALQ
jgi:zinc/manganese transport system substrate-binding protein